MWSRSGHSISPRSNTRGKSDHRPSKPIISPIHFASSGDSYSDTSPPSPKENGLPEQYRRNFNKNYSKQNHHHHHHHRHHHRSGKAYVDKHQHRYQEEDGRGSRRGQIHSKSRRTEHDHFRQYFSFQLHDIYGCVEERIVHYYNTLCTHGYSSQSTYPVSFSFPISTEVCDLWNMLTTPA